MNVLLSINPKHIDTILSGEKKYEFRKSPFKKDVNKVYIYSTSPIKKVVGLFQVGRIIKDAPSNLWNECKESSGLEHFEFFNYFKNKKIGYAIEIKEFTEFVIPLDPREMFANFVPPQSFIYISPDSFSANPC